MSKSVPFFNTALGFRPFFLGAGLAAIAQMAFWLWAYLGGHQAASFGGGMTWHAHEMLFGFTLAVIAGFLLTAVRNWTGRNTATGPMLAGLFLLWFAARVAPMIPGLHAGWLAGLDLGFCVALTVVITIPIIKAKLWRNLMFPCLLVLVTFANLLMHLENLGATTGTSRMGYLMMLYVVLIMIAVIFNRVFPFFAGRVLPNESFQKSALLTVLALLSIAVTAAFDLLQWPGLHLVCFAAGLIHAWVLVRFHRRGIWYQPLLWVLYTGYAWLAVGFVIKGFAAMGITSPFYALHALTAGAMGVMILGMMTRVTLGHTGRRLMAPVPLVATFGLVHLAVVFRVFGPMFWPAGYRSWITVAGSLWLISFAVFTAVLGPILLKPRPDGKPG